ncbi:MAG TPA: phenylalanine 4-monooxygenase [Flavipsychrobacter sp.]|nr:phenylalanine 4-monooxygenase [Flavipsychrobacter sp.]
MLRNKPHRQDYNAYTKEDFEVWHLLFERQLQLLKDNASKLYLNALTCIGFNADEIPDFEKTNKRMLEMTGWRLTVVPELVPQKQFFELLAQKIFPATCWLRTMKELDYLEEPDMFHDVFGHAPLLVNCAYASFMEGFGKLAIQWLHNPEAIALLGRIYWFTIEFGLLRERNENKIFGAGIISSIEETKHSMSSKSGKIAFDIEEMLTTDYRTDTLQNNYFVINSFEELCAALPTISLLIKKTFVKSRYFMKSSAQ